MQHSAACPFVLPSQFGVAVGVAALGFYGVDAELPLQLRRCPHHQAAGWHVFGHNGTGGHQSAFAHGHTVENDGTDSNQAAIQ